jgi:hypothetical protein
MSSLRFIGDSGRQELVLRSGDGKLDRPSISPDGRLISFRISHGAANKTFVARLPASGSIPAGMWSQIDEPTTSGRPCGWSADSSTLYLLLDTDGFRDLWGQRVGVDGRPAGKPYIVRHLHNATGVSTSLGNAITEQGFLYEAVRLTGNIWRLIPEGSAR